MIQSKTVETPSGPPWDIAYQFPEQGSWAEQDYLKYILQHGYELCDGRLERIPVPTLLHQLIVGYLYRQFFNFIEPHALGIIVFAGLRVRVMPGKVREPDLVFKRSGNQQQRSNDFWDGADLVVEVVSPDDPDRDYITKRDEYAHAGIQEYWIADPAKGLITVLTLRDGKYETAGEFGKGTLATSVLLKGFSVPVEAALDPKQ